MKLNATLFQEPPRTLVYALGAGLPLLLWLAGSALDSQAAKIQAGTRRLEAAAEAAAPALEELRSLKELRLKDIAGYKEALRTLSGSKKKAFDTGAALQEEKRLLEKQLEIMTTYLEVDEEAGKIRLMRGDQALKDLPFSWFPLRALGGEARKMPSPSRVVSKERFAQPSRGKVEQRDGKINWEPPQVGKDPRSGGLGEYALFTDGPLVLHGPPLKKELHEAFPHLCAGPTLYTARRLFESVFVGTKIIYKAGPPARPAAEKKP